MNISDAARASGLTRKALRYYESIDLLAPRRADNGYRDYSTADVQALRFIQRARASGFSIDEVRELLELQANPQRRSRDAKQLVQGKLTRVEEQLRNLREMQRNLRQMADSCAGDASPECAILDSLAQASCR